jgi:DNA-binding GntR family transcriptional regulator
VHIPHTARQIADDVRRRVAAGELKRGERLPTYEQIAEEYSSSRRTVGRAVEMLKAEGIVVGVQGAGVFVAEA